MDLLTQLNRAMEYVEQHICDDMTLDDVSSVTSYSPYHFGKLFYYIADMPLSEYIRKRKLTRAAMELQNTALRVIDIAVKYGYDSADSFARAFVKQHGVTPSAARQKGAVLTIFSPMTFQINIKGAQNMNWKIEQRDAFEMLGIETIVNKEFGGEIGVFWNDTAADGSRVTLFDQADERKHQAVYGLINYYDSGKDTVPYMISIRYENGMDTKGYKKVQIPTTTWAIFHTEVKDHDSGCQISNLYQAISEWLPSSGYRQTNSMMVEAYGDGFEEVWTTVEKG